MDKYIQCKDLDKLASIIFNSKPVNTLSGARIFICDINGATFVLKMIQRSPQCDAKHTSDIDTEQRMLLWLRENIIDAGVSPCIVELLYTKECKLHKLPKNEDDFINKSRIYRRVYTDFYTYETHHRNGVMTNRIAFTALEHCQVSLIDYLGWMIDDPVGEMIMKTFLFMIIYTLYAIDVKLPGTLHRDLHAGNVMVKFLKDWKLSVDSTYLQFNVHTSDKTSYCWLLPFYGAFPKIIDFGSAISPGLGLNSCDETRPVGIQENRNDVQTLLMFIYHKAAASGLNRIVGVVNALNPNMHHAQQLPDRARDPEGFPTHEQLLTNEVFTEFTVCDELQKKQANIYKQYDVSVGTFSISGAADNFSAAARSGPIDD